MILVSTAKTLLELILLHVKIYRATDKRNVEVVV